MKRPWRVVAAVAAVAVVALVALPFVLPLDVFRGPIETAASRATGREVHVRGPLHFTLFPELGISAANVSIANAPGARDPDLADIDDLIVAVRFMPLFSGRLDVTELVLDAPILHLEIGKNGEPNWEFLAEHAQKAPAAEDETKNAVSNFALAAMRIDGGRVTYFNAETGKNLAFQDIDLTLATAPGGGPLSLKGSVTYNGEKLALDASAQTPGRFLRDEGTAATGTIGSALFTARFSGNFRTRGESAGDIDVKGDSLRKLLAWAGYPLKEGNNFGLFAVDTGFKNDDKRLSLQKLDAKLDGTTLSGDLVLDRTAPVSLVSGTASIGGLDLDSYFAKDKKAPAADKPAKSGGTTPIDLTALKGVNADLKLFLTHLIAVEMTIDQANVALKLNDGLLSADMDDVSLYGGKGKLGFAIDARGETPKFHHALHLGEVRMLPFLKDLAGIDFIDGKGTLDLDVNSAGDTGRDIWAGLGGKASLGLKNGAVRGVDLEAVSRLVQNLVTAEILNVTGDKAVTKFDEMSGTFAIAGGVARNNDFRLASQALVITASGDIDLADRTLDVHMAPKAVRGLPLPDVGLPFHISGPWAHLRYSADMKGLATSIVRGVAQSPVDALKYPGKALKSLFGLGK